MNWQTAHASVKLLKRIAFLGIIQSSLCCLLQAEQKEPDWQTDIEPVLNDHCVKCHGPLKRKGDLDLSTFHGLIKGGENGPVLIAGMPDTSPVYTVLLEGSDPHMPPKKQLETRSIDLIREWILHFKEIASIAGDQEWTDASPEPAEPENLPAPPKNLTPSQAIDYFIETRLEQEGITPTPVCDDRTFQRRLYLDLIGRPPSIQESERFLRSGSIAKRAEEVDRLLKNESFAVHFTELFDVFLMERRGKRWEDRRKENGWHDFLKSSFAENRPWDQVTRQIILARSDETHSTPMGSMWFLYEREDNHQAMAEAIAPIVFGTQIKCAQCHDHPLAHEIKQGHYWAMVAAFNRSRNVKTPRGIGIAESAVGGFISFANLKKESQPATLTFLNGVSVEETRPDPDANDSDLPEYYLIAPPEGDQQPQEPSIPKFSRREVLADAVTADNPLLARSMVNRLWALMMGRGIVHPVDEMNSKHPPSHPALLHWLSLDFEEHGYDVQRLVRTLVLSETYQRSTWIGQDRPQAVDTFAWAAEKPLSAETAFRSLLAATGQDLGKPSSDNAVQALRQAFIEHFPDLLPVEYNATLQQAMFLSNSPLVQSLLEPKAGNTAEKLLDIENINQRVREAFLFVYGRWPDASEKEAATQFLIHREDRPKEGVQQLLWTLITSAEFLTNH